MKKLLGSSCVRPTALAKLIRKEVPRKAQDFHKAQCSATSEPCRTCRTRAVRLCLKRIGRKSSLTVLPNSDERLAEPIREWLYDLVWWNGTKGKQRLELAVESEWSSKVEGVLYDFRKLLAVKSPLKVLVYCTNTKNQGRVQQRIAKELKEFKAHIIGENYDATQFTV